MTIDTKEIEGTVIRPERDAKYHAQVVAQDMAKIFGSTYSGLVHIGGFTQDARAKLDQADAVVARRDALKVAAAELIASTGGLPQNPTAEFGAPTVRNDKPVAPKIGFKFV